MQVVRVFILVVLIAGAGVVALPIIATSRARDAIGITVPGRVYSKSEIVYVRHSGWERRRDVSIEFTEPDTRTSSFLSVHPDAEQFDSLRQHQAVEVRYLERRNVPQLPLANVLLQLHALPTAAVVTVQSTSELESVFTRQVCEAVGALVVLLVLWRVTKSRTLGIAFGASLAAGFVLLFVSSVPTRTAKPKSGMRRAMARVQTDVPLDYLMSGSRSRGFQAAQPIDVVGLQFVPEGRTEPVLAVDLIDAGSIPDLKERAQVPIQYEESSPRTAWIEGATRRFPERNFNGMVIDAAIFAAFVVGVLLFISWIGRLLPAPFRDIGSRRIGGRPGFPPR